MMTFLCIEYWDQKWEMVTGYIPLDDAKVIDMIFPVEDIHNKIPDAVLVLEE